MSGQCELFSCELSSRGKQSRMEKAGEVLQGRRRCGRWGNPAGVDAVGSTCRFPPWLAPARSPPRCRCAPSPAHRDDASRFKDRSDAAPPTTTKHHHHHRYDRHDHHRSGRGGRPDVGQGLPGATVEDSPTPPGSWSSPAARRDAGRRLRRGPAGPDVVCRFPERHHPHYNGSLFGAVAVRRRPVGLSRT